MLSYCHDHKIAVYTYGGGTSVVGGFEPRQDTMTCQSYKGVICCDIQRMNRILSVDTSSQTVTVEAGVTGPMLENYLKQNYSQYTLRHYPQSFEYASYGGMVVTRSGGHFATGRTRIDHFLQSATMITPKYCDSNSKNNDDRILRTPSIPSSGSGVDLNKAIICGSEGIFGIVSTVTLKLLRKPKYKHNLRCEFMSFEKAAMAVREIVQR